MAKKKKSSNGFGSAISEDQDSVALAEPVPEQMDLPGVESASPMGKAAKKILSIRDEIDEVNEALDTKHANAKKALLELMESNGRDAIVVDGVTFRRVRTEAHEDIKIFKKKGRKEKEENAEND